MLHILVTLAEHIVERLNFAFAATCFAWFLEVAFRANVANDVLAVELLLHATERLVYRLAFADLYFYGHVLRILVKTELRSAEYNVAINDAVLRFRSQTLFQAPLAPSGPKPFRLGAVPCASLCDVRGWGKSPSPSGEGRGEGQNRSEDAVLGEAIRGPIAPAMGKR